MSSQQSAPVNMEGGRPESSRAAGKGLGGRWGHLCEQTAPSVALPAFIAGRHTAGALDHAYPAGPRFLPLILHRAKPRWYV